MHSCVHVLRKLSEYFAVHRHDLCTQAGGQRNELTAVCQAVAVANKFRYSVGDDFMLVSCQERFGLLTVWHILVSRAMLALSSINMALLTSCLNAWHRSSRPAGADGPPATCYGRHPGPQMQR